MMTTRKPAAKASAAQPDTASDSDVVSVDTVPPHAVFHNGEQRTSTLHNVPTHTAGHTPQHWSRHLTTVAAVASNP